MWMHDILSQILLGPKQREMTYLPTVSAKLCVHVAMYVNPLAEVLRDPMVLPPNPLTVYRMVCGPFFPSFLVKTLDLRISSLGSPSPLEIGTETRMGRGSGIKIVLSDPDPSPLPILGRRENPRILGQDQV